MDLILCPNAALFPNWDKRNATRRSIKRTAPLLLPLSSPIHVTEYHILSPYPTQEHHSSQAMPRPIAHVPHFEADCFPDCLKTEYTQFDSLCLEGKLFARGEFDAFLRSGRLLPALQAVTHLTLNDIPNVPRIVLASCVQLQKLEMRGVHIVDDGSRRILAPRPALRELVCPGMDEHSFMLLVSVVDVTRLTMLCCALPEAGTTASSIWPQPLLDLCRGSLSILMLSSLSTSSSIYHIRAID